MRARIAIAGAGIAGLAAAIAVGRSGAEVRVFERAPGLRDAGGALVLWPNGSRALLGLVGPGALTLGRTYDRAVVRAWDGAVLHDIPVGAHGQRYGGPVLALRRGDLLDALYAALPDGAVRFDDGLSAFEVTGCRVVAHSVSGAHEVDGLVGADGLSSVVRAVLHGEEAPRAACVTAWVGTAAPRSGSARASLTTTVGRGLRFLRMPLPDGGAWWYAYTHDVLGIASFADLVRAFRHWHDPIPATLEAADPCDVVTFPLRDRDGAARGFGPMTVVGDAAHPCTPDLGQGACLALEDAPALAGALEASQEVAWAFRSFEAARAHRVELVQLASTAASRMTFPRSAWACGARDLAFAATGRTSILAGLGWLFAEPDR